MPDSVEMPAPVSTTMRCAARSIADTADSSCSVGMASGFKVATQYSCWPIRSDREADIRIGGGYRYVFGRDASNPMAFSGIYKEVTPYTRLVCTQVFEQMRAAGEAVITVTLDERDGKTRLLSHQLYPSKEALDGAIASGMESGMRESYEQLEQLVADVL